MPLVKENHMSSVANSLLSTSLFDWQAHITERAAESVAHWVETTRPDRLSWCPEIPEAKGLRNLYEQVSECANVNRMAAGLFSGRELPKHEGEYASASEAGSDLRASARDLATAIRSLDESALTRSYETPMGPMPGSMLLEITLGNMYYHGGQANYIQMLSGDEEFHIPPSFMGA
jgi:hypothetical protein